MPKYLQNLIEEITEGKICDSREGNSGIVYIIQYPPHRNPNKIVLKTIKLSKKLNEENQNHFIEECKTLFNIKNHFISSPFDVKIVDGIPAIMMKYYDYDLKTLMINSNISEISALVLIYQLNKALITIRNLGLNNHQDLNPPNILIKNLLINNPKYYSHNFLNLDLCISDFGIANLRNRIGPTLGGGGGKYPFKAPEQYNPKKFKEYDPDIFAFAIIAYMLLTGLHPCGLSTKKSLNKNTPGSIFESWALNKPQIHYKDSLIEKYINDCLLENPCFRPTLEDGLNIFGKSIQNLDINTFDILNNRLQIYETFDSAYRKKNKIKNLWITSSLPNEKIKVFTEIKFHFNEVKNSVTDASDLSYLIFIYKHLISVSDPSILNQKVLLNESLELLDLIYYFMDTISVETEYKQISFENEILLDRPDFFDFEILLNYLFIVFQVIKKQTSITYLLKCIRTKRNAKLTSTFYIYSASEISKFDIFKSIKRIKRAQKLNQEEIVIDFKLYLIIRQAYLTQYFDFSSKEISKLIIIANESLMKVASIHSDKVYINNCSYLPYNYPT
ncbi:hypothetical protein EHQ47_17210 [Leptospira bourretii]|uniref:protein kinase domain-containing protein n=1 Tax=Leptospira bourretii TaxID=2484962 RepID=UPI001091108F|nr:protein kinase [Leptospira bourretii]TGL18573.1 hypothetical protein EHQ47_17210 [Leptospira bourretii]